jgi:hypothetical protein
MTYGKCQGSRTRWMPESIYIVVFHQHSNVS